MNLLPNTCRMLGLAALVGLTLGPAAQAAVVVTANVTFNAATNLYRYAYSVQNTSAVDDVVLVSIPTMSVLGVSSIANPEGFSLTYDPSQMWVNLIEDSNIITPQTFAPGSTVAGFSYDSASAPGFVTYQAFDASGAEFSGETQSAVPEPSAALLCGLVAVPFMRRRRA
jgi:hypothetical protein